MERERHEAPLSFPHFEDQCLPSRLRVSYCSTNWRQLLASNIALPSGRSLTANELSDHSTTRAIDDRYAGGVSRFGSSAPDCSAKAMNAIKTLSANSPRNLRSSGCGRLTLQIFLGDPALAGSGATNFLSAWPTGDRNTLRRIDLVGIAPRSGRIPTGPARIELAA